MDENNFVKMFESLKYYYHKHKQRIVILLVVITVIVSCITGQAGQSIAVFSGALNKTSWNPLHIVLYAWFKIPLITIALILVILVIVLYVSINLEDRYYDDERNIRISERGTMGTGGFMKEEDKLNALIMDKIENIDGFILGRDLDTDLICTPKPGLFLNGHKVVCGGSGARKTTTQVLNDLFQIIKEGSSFIVTDPKAEIVGMLRFLCEKRGYITKVLNLVNLENSDGIDFVGGLKDKWGNQNKEIENVQTLADVIMRNTAENVTGGFWDDLQKGLLIAAILYVLYDETGKTVPTLAGAYDFLLKSDKTDIDRAFSNLDRSHPAKAPYMLYAKTEGKVRDSVVTGLMMRLQVLQSEAVKKIVSENEIDLTLPAREKCAYFLVLSDQKSTYDFITSLTFSMFFIKEIEYIDALKARAAKVPVYLVMDEFPSIGTLPDFSRRFATFRSRRIFIEIIFQNYGQIMDKYEKNEWQTMIGNCDTNVYLGGNDITETAQFYSNRLGEMTVVSEGKRTTESLTSITNNRFHPTYMKTDGEASRVVMMPEELMRLDIDQSIVFLKACRPLKVKKFVYTEHPMAKEIVDINATTHFPAWRKREEGYPDLLDAQLSPVIEQMYEDNTILDYLRMHSNNKKYLLLDYLYEHSKDRYDILAHYLYQEDSVEDGETLNDEDRAYARERQYDAEQSHEEEEVAATVQNEARDGELLLDQASEQYQDGVRESGEAHSKGFKIYKPIHEPVRDRKPLDSSLETSSPEIPPHRGEAGARRIYEPIHKSHGLERNQSSGKKITPEVQPKDGAKVDGRFTAVGLNSIQASEEEHQRKIMEMQRADTSCEDLLQALPKSDNDVELAPLPGPDNLPEIDETLGAASIPGDESDQLSDNGLLPGNEQGREHVLQPENSPGLSTDNVTSNAHGQEPGNTPESNYNLELNIMTEDDGYQKPDTILEQSTVIDPICEKDLSAKPDLLTSVSKDNFQIFGEDGKLQYEGIQLTPNIGMKRQADTKARGFSKISSKDF